MVTKFAEDPSGRSSRDDVVPRAAVPAQIDAPDVIAWGLSFRQLAILVAGAALVWTAYQRFGPVLPPAVWVGLAIVVVAGCATVALGRRDGLPLDVWLRHGLALHASPTVLAPADPTSRRGRAGGRPLVVTVGRPVTPAPLRAEVTRIDPDGTMTVDGRPRVVIACGTTSVGLRTGREQAGALAAFGRWLNALPGPVQLVVSAARMDLGVYADAVLDAADRLPDVPLRAAAVDYAEFLLDLDAAREPLRRQVLAVVPAGAGRAAGVRGLTALGITATLLDGPSTAAALAAAVTPDTPPVPGPRAPLGTPVTARPDLVGGWIPGADDPSPAPPDPPDAGRPDRGVLAGIAPGLARWLR